MKLLEFEGFDFEVADDMWYVGRDLSLDEAPIYPIIHGFTKRRLFINLIEAFNSKWVSSKSLVLHAHGNTECDKWVFHDGDNVIAVQDWVAEKDGSAGTLLIMSCNPDNLEVISNRSLIIYPDRILSLPTHAAGRGHLRLWCPGFGYLENDRYKLNKALDTFKAA